MGKTLHHETVRPPSWGDLTGQRKKTPPAVVITPETKRWNDALLVAQVVAWFRSHGDVITTALAAIVRQDDTDIFLNGCRISYYKGAMGDSYGEGRLEELRRTLSLQAAKFGHTLRVTYEWDPRCYRRKGAASFIVTVLT